ncbi:hypothetical protein N2152v2_005219 [Parachlorella kessleri]
MKAHLCTLLALLLFSCLAVQPLNAQETDSGTPAPPASTDEFGDVSAFFGTSPSPGPPAAFGVALAPAEDRKRLKYQGTGTTSYQPDPIPTSGAVGFACSLGYLSPAFLGAYVGVGTLAYNKGYACGQCIKLQCDDAACAQPGKQLIANVVDLCGDCFDADLSIAQPLFQNLTGARGPSASISWEWVACPDLIQGNIKMLQKPQGTAYYQAFSFANSIQPVIAVRMNGQLLKRSASGNWWEWNPGQAINPRGPFKVDLLGANKQVLSVTLPTLRSLDLGVQFRPS